MKTLYILRHAKSSWEDAGLADFDRPLNSRGQRAAPFMGEFIHQNEFVPDIIRSSPALRARETAMLVHENAGLTAPITYDDRIYEASAQTLRSIVSELQPTADSALIVGHNPGIEQLIRYLTGTIESVPTAGLAVIDLEIDEWKNINDESGVLRRMIRPKDEMKPLDIR